MQETLDTDRLIAVVWSALQVSNAMEHLNLVLRTACKG